MANLTFEETFEKLLADKKYSTIKDVLTTMNPSDIAANVVKRILAQADPQMRKEINEILRYPEYSAGSIMTTEYVNLRPSMTCGEAITHIRRTGVDKETIYTCYVTKERKLLGTVTVRELLTSPCQ